MKYSRVFLILFVALAFFTHANAQTDSPLVLVMQADGPIMPPMLEYFTRGIETAERDNAEVLIVQLNTPGGSITTMLDIIKVMRASDVPVVVFVAPRNSYAGSAGAPITFVAHASAMAPHTFIGASTPISESGDNLNSDEKNKDVNASKAAYRPYVQARGNAALVLADSMIDGAKAATEQEALDAKLIDFVANDTDDLLNQLDGFTVKLESGSRVLHTKNADVQPLPMTFIESFLLLLTDPNIVFSLLSIGISALLIELSSPGGWVAGFTGAVCIALAMYGIGVLPVNLFGIVFMIIAFVLFILDIKAPTHGALTTAGVASFVLGALVLFNSPGTPQFQRVSVPLVVSMGIFMGAAFFTALIFVLRAQHGRIQTGSESLLGKSGTAKTFENDAGQVQVEGELWSAEKAPDSESIRKGDSIQVVEVRGLRLIVKKK